MNKEPHLDKPQCPLGHGDMSYVKEWEFSGIGRHSKKPTGCIIELWKCLKCGNLFKKSRKLGDKKQ